MQKAENNDPAFHQRSSSSDQCTGRRLTAGICIQGYRRRYLACKVLLNMKNVVLLHSFLNGMQKTVSSVTSVLTFVLTLLSVRSYSMTEEQKGAKLRVQLKAVGKAFDGYDIPYAGRRSRLSGLR